MYSLNEINLTQAIGGYLASITWTKFIIPVGIFVISQIWISTQFLPLAYQLRGLASDLDTQSLFLLPFMNKINDLKIKINELADAVMKLYWKTTSKNLQRLAIGSLLALFPLWVKALYWLYCGYKIVNFATQLIAVVLPTVMILKDVANTMGVDMKVNVNKKSISSFSRQGIKVLLGGIPFLNLFTKHAVKPADNVASFRDVVQKFSSGDIKNSMESYQAFKNEMNEDYKDLITIY